MRNRRNFIVGLLAELALFALAMFLVSVAIPVHAQDWVTGGGTIADKANNSVPSVCVGSPQLCWLAADANDRRNFLYDLRTHLLAVRAAPVLTGAADSELTGEIPLGGDNVVGVGNGTTVQAKALPTCSATGSALQFDTTANNFACVTLAPSGAKYLVTQADTTLTGEVLVPTCSGTDKLTFDGTTLSCADDVAWNEPVACTTAQASRWDGSTWSCVEIGGSQPSGSGWTGSTSLTAYPKTGAVTTCYGAETGCIVDIDDGSGGKTPYQRLQDALNLLTTKTRVLVRNNSGATVSPTAQIGRTTAWGATKQFFAYGSQRIKIDGASCSGCSAIRWNGAANEHWKGFEVTGYLPDWDGNVFIQNSTAIKIEDFWVHHNLHSNGTIGMLGGANHVIQDTLVWHNGDGVTQGTNNGDCIGMSFDLGNSGDVNDSVIVRAFCRNTGDDGIDLWAGTNARVYDSVVLETGYYWTGGSSGGDGNGFKMGGHSSATGNNGLSGCLSVNNRVAGIVENSARGATSIVNVTVRGNGTGGGIELGAGPLGTNSINHLISYQQSRTTGNVNSGQDYSTATDPWNCWSSQFQGSENTACQDPDFSDAANGDFSLLVTSPYIGTGSGGATLGASTVAIDILKNNWTRK
jgi:hypothetical protein